MAGRSRVVPMAACRAPLRVAPQQQQQPVGCVGAWRLGTGVTTGERQGARCRQPLLVRASGAEGGADSIKQKVAWSTATLIDNRPVNAESNLRALSLSVTDAVRRLEGRNFNGRQEQPRWLDMYQHPGSYVHVRFMRSGDDADDAQYTATDLLRADLDKVVESMSMQMAERQLSPDAPPLFCISTSPSTVHEKSGALDASIIEVLVDSRGPDPFSMRLAGLPPGAQLEVSQVIGRGYGSIFQEEIGLMSSMEAKRDLLLVAIGTQGIAPIRAVLDWIPVQAHATSQKVTLVYEVENAQSAAYVAEWDAWRAAGVNVIPVYKDALSEDELDELVPLLSTLFERPGGLAGVIGSNVGEAVVLMSGPKGMANAALSKMFVNEGVKAEHLLFCDFFSRPY